MFITDSLTQVIQIEAVDNLEFGDYLLFSSLPCSCQISLTTYAIIPTDTITIIKIVVLITGLAEMAVVVRVE